MSGLEQGQRFGMLRVTHIDTVRKVTCVCDCGGACVVHVKELRSGACVSCGCKPATTNGFTAAQVEGGKLDDLGKRVEAHLKKMRGYEATAQEKAGVELRKADNHRNSISQLLADAKAQCDLGGFNAFQKKYCPNFSKSRIYELLAIGEGKKTVEELRAEKRASVAKSREKAKVSTTLPPVVDKPEPPRPVPEPDDATPPPERPAEKPAEDKPTPPVAESTPSPAKPQDIGPYSAGECDRLRARVDELSDEKRVLEIKVTGMENAFQQVNELLKEALAVIDNNFRALGDHSKADAKVRKDIFSPGLFTYWMCHRGDGDQTPPPDKPNVHDALKEVAADMATGITGHKHSPKAPNKPAEKSTNAATEDLSIPGFMRRH